MAFYMVGDITEVQQKADQMAKDIAARKVRQQQQAPATSCSLIKCDSSSRQHMLHAE
jgi:hypothetical protein